MTDFLQGDTSVTNLGDEAEFWTQWHRNTEISVNL